MSVAEVLDEVALSLQLALEAETAAMGRDAGTERRRAWQLILEKLGQQLSVEHLRHWTVLVAEAGDVDLVGELREALSLTGGHPTARAGPGAVAARRRERVRSVIEGEELPVPRLAPKRPAEPTPAQQLASLIDWPPTMADLEMMTELRLSQLVTRKRPVQDC